MTATTEATQRSDIFDLTARRALVTGASRGIGRAIAVAFAERGADVIGVARSAEGLRETGELAAGAAGSFKAHAADLLLTESVEACVKHVADTLGGLDLLVNNAGYDKEASIEDMDLEAWERILDLNLRSCWVMMRAASPHLKRSGGKVINIASVLGLVAMRDDSPYIAAKHGLVGLTRAIALEWAREGVQVNAIAPGFIETAMLPDLKQDEAAAKYIRRSVPMGRWAQPEEIAGAAVFLASSASDYVTGHTLVVDGGLTAK